VVDIDKIKKSLEKKGDVKMHKMQKIWFFVVMMVIGLVGTAEARSPYHTVDVNSYNDVIEALERPTWLVAYCGSNFNYQRDDDQFGEFDYWQTAEEMFFRKKGDCEDYAAFQTAVLNAHGIPAEMWYIAEWNSAHMITIFPYKEKWTYTDSSGWRRRDYLQHPLFDSKEEAVKNYYGKRHREGFMISPSQFSYMTSQMERINEPELPLQRSLRGYHRLPLEMHLTEEIEGGGDRIFQCNFTSPEHSPEVLHKAGVGYLQKVKNLWIGGSVTGHGFYAPAFSECNWKYTLYLTSPRVGLSFYEGHYKGVDVDLKILDFKHLKLYSCFRNWEEVNDHKLKIVTASNSNFFLESVQLEKVDEEFVYGATFQAGSLKFLAGSNQARLGAREQSFEYSKVKVVEAFIGYLFNEKVAFIETTFAF
jgi:hypothetical protein